MHPRTPRPRLARLVAALRIAAVCALVALPLDAAVARSSSLQTGAARPEPPTAKLASLNECVDSCDVMSGQEQCLIECRAHWLRCAHCCLVQQPTATAAHCKAICADDLDAYVCPKK
ncbi:MAG: hypothetical protein ACHREM_15590 [Polyangiales bacterium]